GRGPRARSSISKSGRAQLPSNPALGWGSEFPETVLACRPRGGVSRPFSESAAARTGDRTMDTRIAPGGARMDVIPKDTAVRVTRAGGAQFRDVLTRGASAMLRGAEAAVSSLPGAPIVAAAVRPGTTPIGPVGPKPPGMGLGTSAGTGGGLTPGAVGTAE